MYGWIWRKLPFGTPGKLIGSALLIAITVAVLWFWVFPAAEPLLPFDDVQITDGQWPYRLDWTVMRVLVIDNYDSFVYNLVQYLGQLGVESDVFRNDEITVAEVGRLNPKGVLLSPGPGTPDRAGVMPALIKQYADTIPIFGVCLGHQAIGEAFGGTVTRAPELLHGKTSQVTHGGAGILRGLPDPFTATRYHSLAVVETTLPDEIEVTGRTADSGLVMAMRHRTLPLEGVQFHPESVLTQGGHLMLANWLDSIGYPTALDRAPELAAEVEARRVAAFA